MEQHGSIRLTSAEIASLWTQYMNGSSGYCINKYMINHIIDPEMREVFQFAIDIGLKQLKSIEEFLQEEEFPIPKGFSDTDVNPSAPRLYGDIYCLHYLHIMAIHGTHGYSAAITTSTRDDIREYFINCSKSSTELYNRTLKVLLTKGLYIRTPYIPPSGVIDFIENKSYLTGWFGKKRPLNCLEISNISFNLIKSKMTNTLILGFSQVAQSEEVKKYFADAIKVINAHIDMFSNILKENDLTIPPSFDEHVTRSTVSPFSDKLMMFTQGFLTSIAMVYYGTGLSSSLRTDLVTMYMNAIAGDLKAAAKWSDIMIKHNWIEEPPQAVDRRELSKA